MKELGLEDSQPVATPGVDGIYIEVVKVWERTDSNFKHVPITRKGGTSWDKVVIRLVTNTETGAVLEDKEVNKQNRDSTLEWAAKVP